MTRSGHAYTPQSTRDFEKAFRTQAAYGFPRMLFHGPICIDIRFHFAVCAKHRAGDPHVQKPDADNLEKAVLDALSGHVYVDDAQIFDKRTLKVWAEQSSIYVRVEEVAP